MADARLKVSFAGPLVTVQDGGRFGHLRYGVPASGPMDRLSHAAANVALGNPVDTSAIEISLGGLMLECLSGSVTVSVTGGDFKIDHAGEKYSSWTVITLHKGERLAVRAGQTGSWAYLAFSGQLDASTWLGHTATHSMSGFGGGNILTGQEITIKDASVYEARHGGIQCPKHLQFINTARVVMGPQDQHFQDQALECFLTKAYTLSENYDRMGVRLNGDTLSLDAALSIPSEPIVRGSVQVAGDGVPTVLLSDHQTTGGYPKIATVLSADMDRLVQLRHKDQLRFKAVSPQEAVDSARIYAKQTQKYLSAISEPRGTLEQRLMGENLIGGIFSIPD
ncbi:biotin-dependent carboxyltransferase family protein [Amylibacter sp. SFDW26]|uniref:5-oxoprolinase subunit C family protein n=1 Tax=Amylibacter sp. SFDW26 TaxID=2652722 RepID=UPI001262785E|nr:biotin-dependent carboxyltransferase family protein [Amylibacter sp. SFDW26]KAB7616134.1 biotin-dependent carboxyltransferase family protein [Amylibacter sp. SFDW26]